MSFELKAVAAAAGQLIREVTLPIHAVSLGGIETLITQPALTAHAGVAAKELDALGISDGLIRLSVGIEDTEDLIDDFRRALARIEQSQQTTVCSHGGA